MIKHLKIFLAFYLIMFFKIQFLKTNYRKDVIVSVFRWLIFTWLKKVILINGWMCKCWHMGKGGF